MKYKGFDIELKSGDIVLRYSKWEWYNPMRYLSSMIRFCTGEGILVPCKANHAEVVINDWDTPMLNEASFTLISRPAKDWLEKYQTKIIVLEPIEPINEREFCTRANSKLGAGYWVMGLAWQLLFRITGKWFGPAQEEKMFCSQYAAWCHGIKDPYLFSCKELLNSPYFQIKFSEI